MAFCGNCGSECQSKFCVACGSPSATEQPIEVSAPSPLDMSAASPEVDDAQQARSRTFLFTLLSLLMVAAAFLIGSSMNSDKPSEDTRGQQPAVAESSSTPSVSKDAVSQDFESGTTCAAFLKVWPHIAATNTFEAMELNGLTVYRALDFVVEEYNTEQIPVEEVRDLWLKYLDDPNSKTIAVKLLDAIEAVDTACERHGVDLGLK